jgi:hypothetical protein
MKRRVVPLAGIANFFKQIAKSAELRSGRQ